MVQFIVLGLSQIHALGDLGAKDHLMGLWPKGDCVDLPRLSIFLCVSIHLIYRPDSLSAFLILSTSISKSPSVNILANLAYNLQQLRNYACSYFLLINLLGIDLQVISLPQLFAACCLFGAKPMKKSRVELSCDFSCTGLQSAGDQIMAALKAKG